MYRSGSPVFQFVYSRQYLVGILSGYLMAAVLLHFQFHNYPVENCPVNDIQKPLRVKRTQESPSEVNNSEILSTLAVPTVSHADIAVTLSTRNRESQKTDRILCWVVTTPTNKFKAEMVKNTWGQRCDKLLFMSSQNDSSLPAIGLPLPGPESRAQLWNKAKLTFRYVYDNYINEYDWFYKADDDTYAIVENMRHYVKSLNSSEPLFLGRQFHGFLSGGSGYLLTRESMRRLVEKGLDQNICNTTLPGGVDDVIIAHCLRKLDVKFGDTRDEWGHQRFIPYNVEEFYSNEGPNMNFIRNADLYPFEPGYNCCSTKAISFHYVSGYKMQMYEYLLYHLKILNDTAGF